MEQIPNLNVRKPQQEEPVYKPADFSGVEVVEVQEDVASFAGKLSSHILGLRIDDPKLAERLIEDQKILRAKYGLPSLEAIPNNSEYEIFLRKLAESLKITINSKSECGEFFEEYPYAGGVHFELDKKVGLDIKRTSEEEYSRSLRILEHELIHGLQQQHSPGMPIELREYEAYIAGGNNKALIEDPELARVVFSHLIGGSVMHWYDEQSKKRGETVTPAWL